MDINKIVAEIGPLSYEKDLRIALEAAKKAGDRIDEAAESGEFNSRQKTKDELVTDIDEKCQEIIIDTIENERQGDGFLAEEEEVEDTDHERVWVIDPIDGTANFATGIPNYGVSICLKVEREAEVAVVHSPSYAQDITFIAVRGEGSYRVKKEEIKRNKGSDRKGFDFSNFQVGLQERYPSLRPAAIKMVEKLLGKGATIRRFGTAALDICLVASGGLDGYVNYAKEWDIAAAELIAREAGVEFRADRRDYDGLIEVMAASEGISDEFFELYEQVKTDTGVIFGSED